MSGTRLFRRTTLALAVLACTVSLGGAGCVRPSVTVRAQALVRQGHDDEAVAMLEQRLTSHPDDVPARRLLVRVLAAAGNIVGARAQVTELAKWLPADDPTAYLELGHALELTHSYDEALEAYDEAAAIAPTSPDGPREGGLRSARWGELEEAKPRLEEALRRSSARSSARTGAQSGARSTGVAASTDASEARAEDVETWHTLGLVLLHLEDYDGAVRAYRTGAAIDPKDATCWLGLASVGVVRGDAQLTLEAYDQVLARSPRFASAQLGRAWALSQLGRRDEAALALDRAQELGAPPGPLAKQRAALTNLAGSPLPHPADR